MSNKVRFIVLSTGMGLSLTAALLVLAATIQPAQAALPVVERPSTAAAISTTPVITLTGIDPGSEFGTAVSTAGDVNGDGYSDFIVGAPRVDALNGLANQPQGGSTNFGRAYIFHGGPGGLGQSPSVTLTGETSYGGWFGSSVATAGDINGDGFADVIVGAQFYYTMASGSAHVYQGGPAGIGQTPVLTITGEADNRLGSSVATAGDVNGDGFSDVLISEPNYNNGSGAVLVYYGSLAGLAATPAITLTGESDGDRFGVQVATAGDVNGDGFSDVVVGALYVNGGVGAAYIFHGGVAGLSASFAISLTGPGGGNFGNSVSTIGDVNGDGYAEVVVGAPFEIGDVGGVYVYAGGPGGISAVPVLSIAGQAGSFLGQSVATAGDMNGDGYADLVVAAPGLDEVVYVYPGSATGLNAGQVITFTDAAAADDFGHTVATAGDVNGDGYSDLAIGVRDTNFNTGLAFVYAGSPGAAGANPVRTFTGEAVNDALGTPVATAGDSNGDGYADLIVGAAGYGSNRGRVYVYKGGAGGLSVSPGLTLTGGAVNDRFGISLSTAGDVNNDGYADTVIGASGYNGNQGQAYIYHGGPGGLGAVANLTLTGPFNSSFGRSVGAAGDVNGDGFADVVIGAFDANLAFVYHGGAGGLSASPAITLTGAPGIINFGWSVATAGDVNGDGYSDIVIGAYGYILGTGRAYIFHGGPGGLNAVAARILTGEAPGNNFGWQVSTAGDINGDGFADLLVAAYRYGTSRGRAYIYHGSAAGLGATSAISFTGEANGQLFGYSAGTAGDVNGDGFADVLVGAMAYNITQGRAYLYAGGAGGLSATPVISITGAAPGDRLGGWVATAGDTNGDGYADLALGAPGYAGVVGRAYVHAGNEQQGLALAARMLQPNNTDPLAYLGQSHAVDSFRLALTGRTPYGRALVKLEWEVKPLGVAFDGTGTQVSADWQETGIAGAALNELVTGLSANTVYHWRVRLLYHVARSPFQQASRWFTQPWNGWEEARLRTGPELNLQRLFLPLLTY